VTDFSLVIMGNDWIMIIFVALVMILGTKRMPEASKKIGKIMGQFNKTKNIVQDEIQKVKGDFSIPIQGPVTSERQKLEIMAKTLGIDSKDKTDDDLRNLISSRIGGTNTGKGSEQSAN
jgi:sec-independent protein translocase protein TatA